MLSALWALRTCMNACFPQSQALPMGADSRVLNPRGFRDTCTGTCFSPWHSGIPPWHSSMLLWHSGIPPWQSCIPPWHSASLSSLAIMRSPGCRPVARRDAARICLAFLLGRAQDGQGCSGAVDFLLPGRSGEEARPARAPGVDFASQKKARRRRRRCLKTGPCPHACCGVLRRVRKVRVPWRVAACEKII